MKLTIYTRIQKINGQIDIKLLNKFFLTKGFGKDIVLHFH
jgi:hypothetical protein